MINDTNSSITWSFFHLSQYHEPLFTDGDDAPLPALENLQISGEPYPGHELQACGYSINGTTSCNFEVCTKTDNRIASFLTYVELLYLLLFFHFQWVCHLEDGSVNYIDGTFPSC